MSDGASLLSETEQFFHEQIPITQAMGVKVEAYDEEHLVLTAPLEANHNHLGTAFGGSLAAVATLAGYGMVWLQLGDRNSHVVIRDSKISYRHPVKGIIRAICRRPDAATLSSFKAKFAAAGKARLELRVTIEQEEKVCVEYDGTFVAIR